MFWTLNKTTNQAGIYGSIAAITKDFPIKDHFLYNCFDKNRKGLKEFEDEAVRIVKCKMIRAKRSI